MASTVLRAFHAISLNPCTYRIAYRSYWSPYYTRRGQSSERELALSVFSAVRIWSLSPRSTSLNSDSPLNSLLIL